MAIILMVPLLLYYLSLNFSEHLSIQQIRSLYIFFFIFIFQPLIFAHIPLFFLLLFEMPQCYGWLPKQNTHLLWDPMSSWL